MNRRTKNIALSFTGLIAVLLISSTPAAVQGAATRESRESSFCANLTPTISEVNTSISNLTYRLSTARSDRDRKRAAEQTTWDQEIATNRSAWDQKRQDSFAKLADKAAADGQTTAVDTYIKAVKSAVAARRAANDAARTAYRTGVDNVIAAQQATLDTQVTALRNAVTSAQTAAQASCAASPSNGAAARAAFQAALKTARQAYAAHRKDDAGVGNQIRALAQTRNNAIRANDTAFNSAIETARNDLKKAFGDDSI